MSTQYLDSTTLISAIPLPNFNVSDFITTDSYNETKILQKFKQFSPINQELILKSIIHVAIIGAGNKNYGQIKVNDKILEIKKILDDNKILYGRGINEKYSEDQLTVRRLLRLFRNQIQQFISTTGRASYLFNKYSTHDASKVSITFPGAEHIITNEKDADYLIETYSKLDEQHKTLFVGRLKRVFDARGISYKK